MSPWVRLTGQHSYQTHWVVFAVSLERSRLFVITHQQRRVVMLFDLVSHFELPINGPYKSKRLTSNVYYLCGTNGFLRGFLHDDHLQRVRPRQFPQSQANGYYVDDKRRPLYAQTVRNDVQQRLKSVRFFDYHEHTVDRCVRLNKNRFTI